MHTVWLITLNNGSWGKGWSMLAAMAAALAHSDMHSIRPNECHIYAIEVPEREEVAPFYYVWSEGDAFKACSVDAFGNLTFPAHAKLHKLPRQIIDDKVTKSFFTFREAVQQIEYRQDWRVAFVDVTQEEF